jgi:perosamine synthetase
MNVPFFKIYWDEKDIISVNNVIKRGKFWAGGPTIDEFEKKIAQYVEKKYCVVFNSGTSALHVALLAYGIKEGDEVIVPAFTFIATANSPLFVGARPIFAEIENKNFGLDPKDVKKKITKKTKAIIAVHYAGCPCLIEELKKIAEENNLILIEDVAESFGGKFNGKMAGTFGDAAMFSFCQNKIITTGEGGAIVTDSKEIYEKMKLIRSHGRQEDDNYKKTLEYLDYITLGYNFRMAEIIAALGTSQMKKVDKLIKMRRENAKYYKKKLAGISEIIIPEQDDNYFNVYQMFTINIKDGEEKRNDLIKKMETAGIGTKIYFHPIHLSKYYKNEFGYKCGDLPITEKISNQVLSLPMYPELSKKEIDYVINVIKKSL